jgi:hypothetical protein
VVQGIGPEYGKPHSDTCYKWMNLEDIMLSVNKDNHRKTNTTLFQLQKVGRQGSQIHRKSKMVVGKNWAGQQKNGEYCLMGKSFSLGS